MSLIDEPFKDPRRMHSREESPIVVTLPSTPDQGEQTPASQPPTITDTAMLRRGFARWLFMGGVRLLYRTWTRIAVRLFPADSRRAAVATRLGIPLPDRLNMSWVTEQLAVGGRVHPDDIRRLAETGVGAVVDTRSEHQDDAAAMRVQGIELLTLPARDTFPLTTDQLLDGATWVNEQIAAGRRVLIHCEHGVGRSVLLTAAVLVQQGMHAHQAITLIQRRRWQAAPNHRQMRRLQQFECAMRGSNVL